MKTWLIPHPNVPNTEFGDAHLKRITTLFNENFAKLDALMQSAQASVSSLESSKSSDGHKHDDEYAQLEHKHVPDDVTGLSSLLDNKANLNHEHSQYLTEVTAHQHETNEINGLLESLNGKAPTAHGHTFSDVDGLDNLSASAARTSYVDQRDTEKLAAAMAYTDAAVSGIVVPKASSLTPYKDSENGSSGSATSFARGDHRHPVNYPSGKPTTNIKRDGAGSNGTPLFGTTNNYADLGHSHPLNVPEGEEIPVAKHVISLTKDGLGTDTENGAALGSVSLYARLDHIHGLNVASSGYPSDVVKPTGFASLGTSKTYARTDHVHKMTSLSADDISYGTGTVKGTLDDHEGRIEDLEEAIPGTGKVESVDGVSPVSGSTNVVLNALTTSNYGDTLDDVYQSISDKLTDVQDHIDENGFVLLSGVKGDIDGHSGDCLVTVDENGNLGHSGNKSYNALSVVVSDYDENANTLPYAKFNTDTVGSCVVKTNTSGELIEDSDTYAKFSVDPEGGKFVKTNGTDGTLDEAAVVEPNDTFDNDELTVSAVSPNSYEVKTIENPTFSTITAGVQFSLVKSEPYGDFYQKIYMRDLIVDKYGRITGVSDWSEKFICPTYIS